MLAPEWRRIVRRAWSFRFMLLAAVFGTLEVILPFYADSLPRGLFAALTLVAILGGLISRVIAQKDFNA